MSTNIEWTDDVWNPTRGCSRCSPGCKNCYAERQAIRQRNSGYKGLVTITNGHPAWTGEVRLVGKKLNDPLRWRKPRRIFVDSMSDLFHEKLAFHEIFSVHWSMLNASQHTYQVLTKRAERARDFYEAWPYPDVALPKNLWLGVSVEDRERKARIDVLRGIPVPLRFLSIEPLLEDIGELNLDGIQWVIVGGESGPGARQLSVQWIRSIVSQCQTARVPVFVKQFGANVSCEYSEFPNWDPDLNGYPIRDRKGGEIHEWPADLRVREFPEVRG